MTTKKWTILLVAAIFAAGLTACGGGGEAELQSVVKKYNKEMENFINAMEKADDGKTVAAALTGFATTMKEMKPVMEKMAEKYPGLKNMQGIPEELGEEGQKMQALAMQMGAAMMKAMQYSEDPDVMKAQKVLEDAMK